MKFVPYIFIFYLNLSFAVDTLLSHPKYPPITYEGGDYRFYKYTAKYIPENMLQCFKILATCGDDKLVKFMNRTEEEVLEKGIHYENARLRKEFCLDGFSSFSAIFHDRGIYYPYAMESYILLSFHQYLNKDRIRWFYNKRVALDGKKELNKAWKKRVKEGFDPVILEDEPAAIKDPVFTEPEGQFFTY